MSDPAGRPVEDVRPIRDDIGERVRGIVAELGLTLLRSTDPGLSG